MEYLNLGGTGMEVSALCLGTWMFGTRLDDGREVVDEAQAHTLLDAAWTNGINFLDTANGYGDGNSERYIGDWLADKEREDFIVASKVYYTMRGRQPTGLSRKIIRSEIRGSLNRLQTDYLDIYYIHGWHATSPLEETLRAINDLVREGRVHYLGVSNFSAAQLVRSAWINDKHDWAPIAVIQPRYNAADHVPFTVDPEEQALPDLFDTCRDLNVAVCPYAPLGGGFLAGKYQRGPNGATLVPEGSRAALAKKYGTFSDRWWRVLDAVREVASETEVTPAQVALRWASMVEGLTSIPIFGGRTVDQLTENIAAMDVGLSPEQYARIADAGQFGTSDSPYLYTG